MENNAGVEHHDQNLGSNNSSSISNDIIMEYSPL